MKDLTKGERTTKTAKTKNNNHKSNGKNQKKPKSDWMRNKPNNKDLYKPRQSNRKPWYYCAPVTDRKCDEQYQCHKPSEYKGIAFSPNQEMKQEKNKKKPLGRSLKLAKAMMVHISLIDETTSIDSDDLSELQSTLRKKRWWNLIPLMWKMLEITIVMQLMWIYWTYFELDRHQSSFTNRDNRLLRRTLVNIGFLFTNIREYIERTISSIKIGKDQRRARQVMICNHNINQNRSQYWC